MIALLAWLWQIEPVGLALLIAAFVIAIAALIYESDGYLLPVWIVANVWHWIKTPEPNRSEIREAKYQIGCAELNQKAAPKGRS